MSAAVLTLLLADSRTPAGGYAHSGGLEAAVEAGLGVAGVPGFAAARLETVARVDAAFAAAACRAVSRDECSSGGPYEPQRNAHPLLPLDDELAARTPSPPLRAAARQLGRALLRLAERLWPEAAVLAAYRDVSAWTPRPVVLGAVAATAGLAPLDAARLSLYEDAAGVAAAAVKLLPLDAAEATAWVAALAPRIDALAREAAAWGEPDAVAPQAVTPQAVTPQAVTPQAVTPQAVTPQAVTPHAADPLAALPAAATPLLDLRALAHDQSMGRLFVT